MLNKRIKMLYFYLVLSCGFACSQKPTIKVEAMPAEKTDLQSEMPKFPQIQATLSDEDWQKLQGLIPVILPRLLAMESAILWVPHGTSFLSTQTGILIGLSEGLSQKTSTLIELSERLLKETQKAREAIELMIKSGGAKN